jgi:hypothetical protein
MGGQSAGGDMMRREPPADAALGTAIERNENDRMTG